MNFFAGMDQRVPREPAARWLAVTSLSFDISVLELCWTLARGFTVVLHSDAARRAPAQGAGVQPVLLRQRRRARSAPSTTALLLEGAKFADRDGFAAVWTPERHFHAFGGLYPNPVGHQRGHRGASPRRVQIRAGSCVLPLHHPVRVAEEWAVVDNISNGRVGISFASGWQPNDFVLMPDAFARRAGRDDRATSTWCARLWRGEAVAFPGPQRQPGRDRARCRGRCRRRLPVWITAAGNPETFEQAGRWAAGC